MSNGRLLRDELRHWQDTAVDMADLLHSTHSLLRLGRPILAVLDYTDTIRRWEPWAFCLVLIGLMNGACIFLSGYYVVFSLALVLTLAGLGYSHRQTNILAKVLPAAEADSSGPLLTGMSSSSSDLSQSELLDEFRLLLCLMSHVTSELSQGLLQLYSLLKWEDLHKSLKYYAFLLCAVILFHALPVRWTFTILFDVFMLHYPFQQYYCVLSTMFVVGEKKQRPLGSGEEMGVYSEPQECQYQASNHDDVSGLREEEELNEEAELEELEDEEDLDDMNESSGEEDCIELKVTSPLSETSTTHSCNHTSSDKLVTSIKRPGVVGKILKTVKPQGGARSCAGCNVNFTTILKRRRLCSHCGNHFCSRCCSYKVTRSMFGATAPAAQTETVNVCFYCVNYLNKMYRDGNRQSTATTEGAVGILGGATGAAPGTKDKLQ